MWTHVNKKKGLDVNKHPRFKHQRVSVDHPGLDSEPPTGGSKSLSSSPLSLILPSHTRLDSTHVSLATRLSTSCPQGIH